MSGKNRRGCNGNETMRKSSSASSSSSFFSLVKLLFNKPRRGRRSGVGEQDTLDEAVGGRRIRPSDDDKPRWVAEPGIDKKATEFIAMFYEKRVSDADRQTVSVEKES